MRSGNQWKLNVYTDNEILKNILEWKSVGAQQCGDQKFFYIFFRSADPILKLRQMKRETTKIRKRIH
jgi:hypothetical protein